MRVLVLSAIALPFALLGATAQAQTPAYHRLTGDQVIWNRKPEGGDMAAAYPRAAMDAERGGAAVLECLLTPKGGVADCVVLAESEPAFGEASLKVVRKFGFDPRKAPPEALTGAVVAIPISWGAPNAVAPSTLEYVAGRRAYLMTPTKAGGKIACGTKAAPDQRCDLHDLSWDRQPYLEDTALAVRSVDGGPPVTGLMCATRPDRQLDGCEPLGEPTDAQLNAMDQLAGMFTAKAKADDKTPLAQGRVMLRFNWPVLRRAVDASRLSPSTKP
ncbi:TonB family protein [Caulobacter sp. CCNWLY153]|uniref:TonB family protein n=1 Tax=unclassified Caulobacter TaxID=2648921 RepID=UPI002FEEAE49